MLCCGRCHQTLYCSKTCQKQDWHKGHKNACQSATKTQQVKHT
jgi:hypothetical protein